MEGDSRQSPHWRLGLLGPLLTFIFMPLVASHFNQTCAPGVDTPGVTYPRGDIYLEAGQPLELFCVLNPHHREAIGRNASHLVFLRNHESVPPEFVHVVNATTLRLYVKEMPASSSMYYCHLKPRNGGDTKPVCLNSVFVGYKPQEVQNFTCISYNWQSLTCSWVPPHNYVKTVYTLVYRLPGRAGGRIQYGCPKKLDIKENKCFWDAGTTPHYRQPYEYYFFTINGRNTLGNMSSSKIQFHHYAHVIPAEPKNLRVLNTTYNSILLKWDIPHPLPLFPPGLIQKVEYQHQWLPRNSWVSANTSYLKMQNESYVYNLTNLEYAHTIYDIRVYMKSAAAIGDDWWSKPSGIAPATKPIIPGAAPKTDVGSFEVIFGLPLREVYIYWQQIPDYLHNGDDFEYKIIEVKESGQLRNIYPSEMSRAYAKFKELTFNDYTFTIISANKEGRSLESSTVFIPNGRTSPREPVSFTKIAFGNGIYELSWKHPAGKDKIVNYTIFWCNNDRDRPYQCVGYLNWTHVSSDIQIINITVPEDKIYQFAISANTENASSGMVWASCTIIHNKAVSKMKSVWTGKVGSTFIEVGWKLECSDRIGLVEGYFIYYCPIQNPYNLTCKDPEKRTKIVSSYTDGRGRAEGLIPYTTYMVFVSILTKGGEGLPSDPLYVTTLEGAPDTPPTNVTLTHVTSSSMVVSWTPPLLLNGVLRCYEIFYNNDSLKHDKKTTTVTLENLKSYTDYEVRVSACTVSCSQLSEPVRTRTAVGVPGLMERPSVSFINSSLVLVSWKPPEYAAGITSYYELKVQREGPDSVYYYEKYAPGVQVQVPVSDCEVEGSINISFVVRAVNIGPGKSLYKGPWSEALLTNCFNSVQSQELQIWVPVGVAIVVVLFIVGYVSKRAYHHYIEMSSIEIKIPDGLQGSSDLLKMKEKDFMTFGRVSPPEDHDRSPKKLGLNGAADEQKLLDGPERHGRNPSGGSCGHGSAHESVSSERTSGTQISSDSGADVDRYPPSPDIFGCPQENNLRFRTQSLQSDSSDIEHGLRGSRDYIADCSESPPLTYGTQDYLRMGLPENELPPPGGYVTLESVANQSAIGGNPDTSCLDGVSSMSSSNYVAHPNTWMPKEASLLIPVCTTENSEVAEEGSAFVEAPDSYCRVAWQPEMGNVPDESETEVFTGRPSLSVAEPTRSPVSEGYVTVASLGAALPSNADSVRCPSLSVSPTPDCGLDSGETLECTTDTDSQPSRMASPGYVALGYFAKEEGICNSNRDVLDSVGGTSSGETTYHALTNEKS